MISLVQTKPNCEPVREKMLSIEEQLANYKARLAPPERLKPRKCRICGCTQSDACPGGCTWHDADLCMVCAKLRKALRDFCRDARRSTLAGVTRLFKEVNS
jgi:hypothetical protein